MRFLKPTTLFFVAYCVCAVGPLQALAQPTLQDAQTAYSNLQNQADALWDTIEELSEEFETVQWVLDCGDSTEADVTAVQNALDAIEESISETDQTISAVTTVGGNKLAAATLDPTEEKIQASITHSEAAAAAFDVFEALFATYPAIKDTLYAAANAAISN